METQKGIEMQNKSGNPCDTKVRTQWGGGALGSQNVSKLVSKEVRRNFTLALLGRGQGEGLTNQIAQRVRDDMSIQVSDNETEKLDCHVADAPRNDKTPTHPNLPLKREGTVRHPELVSASQNDTFFSRFTSHFSRKRVAFTLAEVLITLGIIGVVAALTLPSVIQNYKKKVTVERLKKTYSTLAQAMQMSVQDNDEVETWNFSLSAQEFMDAYITPYIKDAAKIAPTDSGHSKKYVLSDGTIVSAWKINGATFNQLTFVQLAVDVNGDANPNVWGKDKFSFYIFPKKYRFYNSGSGDMATGVPRGGLYPDGYGYSRNTLKNDMWRGCNRRGEKVPFNDTERTNVGGAFCTALIMLDGWKISDDYKW